MPSFGISKSVSLVDEYITIGIKGASPRTPVTLHLSIVEPYGSFYSFCHLITNQFGNVDDISQEESTGGTFVGKEAMGLFWSLIPSPGQRRGLRLLTREASRPLRFRLTMYFGHLTNQEVCKRDSSSCKPQCEVTLLRTYLSDEVERIEVRHGKVRGALFRPKGQEKHNGILDLFGTGGGLIEHRAALLASKGFCVLALAMFAYDDLPKALNVVDMDYFKEAVDFLVSHPLVHGGKIGAIGTSRGADIILQLSILNSTIRAVVLINPLYCNSMQPMFSKGKEVPYNEFDFRLMIETARGYNSSLCYDIGVSEDYMYKIENSKATCLIISSGDDDVVASFSGGVLARRLRDSGKKNFHHIHYPGAGHLLEPPYSSCTSTCYHGAYHVLVNYGGRAREHHIAQVDLWHRMQRFLRNELGMVAKL